MSERTFEARPAARENTPILVGIFGASGGGKTFSALRLARGIVSVTGGEIYFIDTDNRRSLQYADEFKKADGSPGFKHVNFPPPHGSEDYVAAIRYCVAQKDCGVIITDSMSHEHEGIGGLLDFHEREHARLGGRDTTKALAWAKPKAARRKLLLEIQRLNVPAIFCFRAKEGVKPMTVPKEGGGTKTEFIQQGFTPIAGDEFLFEMTLAPLLYPASKGVPEWNPIEVGERKMTKLPKQFESLAGSKTPIDEELGARLARWSRGGVKRPAAPPAPDTSLPPPDEPENGPAGDDRARPDVTRAATPEERAAARGFSGEGLGGPPLDSRNTDQVENAGDDFPGDRPQGSAAGGATAEDRPASPAAGNETRSNATAGGAPQKPSPSAPGSDFGFVDLANALADGKTWPDLSAALQSLTRGQAWKDAAKNNPGAQARARSAVFHRLRELVQGGLKFDFLDDPHAFRCYVEWESDGPAIQGNFAAFKLTPAWGRLPTDWREAFEKAVANRLSQLSSADAGATEGDFN